MALAEPEEDISKESILDEWSHLVLDSEMERAKATGTNVVAVCGYVFDHIPKLSNKSLCELCLTIERLMGDI